MGWSLEHIEKLAKEGKIKGYHIVDINKKVKAVPVKKKEATGLQFIKRQLDKLNIPYVTEYHFAKPRMFRFDVALPVMKVAFEYEGIVAGKSRHTSVKGYTRDATKYNVAAANGWRVYRYTALNYKDFENDIKSMFK